MADTRPDVVVDFLCYTGEDARLVIDAFSGCTGRLVMISTGSVYWCTGSWDNPVTEEQYARDSVPERRGDAFHPGSIEYAYGKGKRDAEDLLHAATGRLPSVRLRFPVIGGAGDPTGRYAGYIRRIADGRPLLVPGGGWNSFRHLYVEDAAAAILAAAEQADAGGGYNVTSGEIVSVRDLLAGIAACLGCPLPAVAGPDAMWLMEHGPEDLFAPFSSLRDQIMDPGRAVREWGYAPAPYATWLARTVADCSPQEPAPDREKRQEEVAAAELFSRTLSAAPAYLDSGESA